MIKHPFVRLICQIAILIVMCCCAAVCFVKGYYVAGILSAIAALVAALSILRLYNGSLKKVAFMFDAIENNDYSFRFTGSSEYILSDAILNRSLNRIKELVQNARDDIKESEKYFQTILEQVNTGIVVINDSGVVFQINNQALKLLHVSQLSHIRQLSFICEDILSVFIEIEAGESRTITFFDEVSKVTLSVTSINVQLQDKTLKILAITDIGNNIDMAEQDSWNRMSKVLTHEIMNSLAPITSLSETLISTTDPQIRRRGLEVINSTAENLKSFVEKYRLMTRVAVPVLAEVDLAELVAKEISLFSDDIELDVCTGSCIAYVDQGQISQVIVNLLKNGCEAIASDRSSGKKVWVVINRSNMGKLYIDICDNGAPIDDNIRENIFVPFFTTKEKGSGIGLSLSRQIMRLHGGSVTLATRPFTRFRIQF